MLLLLLLLFVETPPTAAAAAAAARPVAPPLRRALKVGAFRGVVLLFQGSRVGLGLLAKACRWRERRRVGAGRGWSEAKRVEVCGNAFGNGTFVRTPEST